MPSEPKLLPLMKKLAAWVSSSASGSASDTLHTESERCRGDIRRPPSLPQREEDERDGEADINPRLAGARPDAGAGRAGDACIPFDGDRPPTMFMFDPTSQLLVLVLLLSLLSLREEAWFLLLGDGIDGRRWCRGPPDAAIGRGGSSGTALTLLQAGGC